jgi:hypothetical protein
MASRQEKSAGTALQNRNGQERDSNPYKRDNTLTQQDNLVKESAWDSGQNKMKQRGYTPFTSR